MSRRAFSIAILVGSIAVVGCGMIGKDGGDDGGRIPVPTATPTPTPLPEITPTPTPTPHTVARTVTIKSDGTISSAAEAEPEYAVTTSWKMSDGVSAWDDAMKTWDYDDSSWGETAVCSGKLWSKDGGCSAAGDFVLRSIVDLGPDSIITRITVTSMAADDKFLNLGTICPLIDDFIDRAAEFAFYMDGVLQCEHHLYTTVETFTSFGIPQNGRHLFVTPLIQNSIDAGGFGFNLTINYNVSEFGP